MTHDIVAYEEGRKAAADDLDIENNPYSIMGSVTKYRSWNAGYASNEQINHAMLQLAAESGEVVKLWAKHLYKPGHEVDRDKIIDELGDLFYYVRIIAYLYDITIDELTEFNHQKLVGGHGWNGSDEKVKARMDK